MSFILKGHNYDIRIISHYAMFVDLKIYFGVRFPLNNYSYSWTGTLRCMHKSIIDRTLKILKHGVKINMKTDRGQMRVRTHVGSIA